MSTQPSSPTASWAFNLHDESLGIPRTLAEGITTRIFPGQNVMLSVVQMAPHAEGTLHSHPEEQWGVLLAGECVRVQDGEEKAMKAGDFWCTPGGVPHTVRTGDKPATIIDIFSPPREEYRKAGSGFGTT
jgi:quercetin dioxygenase-like cupin family protein